jgi:hypothetical protein
METSQRLLIRVSNGENADVDSETRGQIVENLIGFNRVYRRLAEQSNDRALADVLQQVESMLLEISHTSGPDMGSQWNSIRERLDRSDLIFKLKVSNQKVSQEII